MLPEPSGGDRQLFCAGDPDPPTSPSASGGLYGGMTASIDDICENLYISRMNSALQTMSVIDPKDMLAAADEASEFLKLLGNRHRLLILCQLVGGEKSVGQLAGLLGLRDSTVSQHLALMRRDRIITGRRDGQTIWYRIASAPALRIMAVLYETFCGDAPLADAGSPLP